MDKKIKKIQSINKKEGRNLKELLREDKVHDKVIEKAKSKMKGRC